MKRIEMEQYEVNDLIRTLDYAKSQKYKDYKKGKFNLKQYTYEVGLIEDLLKRIDGKKVEPKIQKTELIEII